MLADPFAWPVESNVNVTYIVPKPQPVFPTSVAAQGPCNLDSVIPASCAGVYVTARNVATIASDANTRSRPGLRVELVVFL